jgi:hypothetical protein
MRLATRSPSRRSKSRMRASRRHETPDPSCRCVRILRGNRPATLEVNAFKDGRILRVGPSSAIFPSMRDLHPTLHRPRAVDHHR